MIGAVVEDRYLVEEELGTGAMGCVYAARHIRVGRRVAIKVMHEELAKNALIVERFAREALIAARLRHPNLVSVLDVGTSPNGQPLTVLELAPGRPLSELEIPMAPVRLIRIVRQLLEGLAHAHAAGLIHRDLKPDNILVDEDDVPRIVDFGIAVMASRDDSAAGRRLTEANIVIGTPFYMSPEQARAKDVDQRTDLFSLGVIMYELLAGMPPFPGTTVDVALANTSREPPSIYERAGIEVDPLLEAFARKLMARSLDARFASARQALDVLALIERDRMAATRALAGEPIVEVAPAPVVTFANTDGMATMIDVMRDIDADVACERTVARRRMRVGVAIATAAMVCVAAVGFAMRPRVVDVPRADVEAREDVLLSERVAIAERSVEVVALKRPVARNVASRNTATDAKLVKLIAMTKAETTRLPSSTMMATLPVDAMPAVAVVTPNVDTVSADAVVAKYIAIGKALKQATNADELWARFRLIRINEAISTPTSRQQALVALASIEKSLAR